MMGFLVGFFPEGPKNKEIAGMHTQLSLPRSLLASLTTEVFATVGGENTNQNNVTVEASFFLILLIDSRFAFPAFLFLHHELPGLLSSPFDSEP